jgi:hypothetical protein
MWHYKLCAKLENGYDATANDQNQLSWLLDHMGWVSNPV